MREMRSRYGPRQMRIEVCCRRSPETGDNNTNKGRGQAAWAVNGSGSGSGSSI